MPLKISYAPQNRIAPMTHYCPKVHMVREPWQSAINNQTNF